MYFNLVYSASCYMDAFSGDFYYDCLILLMPLERIVECLLRQVELTFPFWHSMPLSKYLVLWVVITVQVFCLNGVMYRLRESNLGEMSRHFHQRLSLESRHYAVIMTIFCDLYLIWTNQSDVLV